MVAFCQVVSAWKAATDGQDDHTDFQKFLFNNNVMITILILGSVFAGFGQAIIWVAQGEYMSLCATESTSGFYMGYFWTLYMSSQICGNALGSVLIL